MKNLLIGVLILFVVLSCSFAQAGLNPVRQSLEPEFSLTKKQIIPIGGVITSKKYGLECINCNREVLSSYIYKGVFNGSIVVEVKNTEEASGISPSGTRFEFQLDGKNQVIAEIGDGKFLISVVDKINNITVESLR